MCEGAAANDATVQSICVLLARMVAKRDSVWESSSADSTVQPLLVVDRGVMHTQTRATREELGTLGTADPPREQIAKKVLQTITSCAAGAPTRSHRCRHA